MWRGRLARARFTHLLLRTRLWWNQSCQAVIHDQLAVMLAAVLDEAVGVVDDPDFLMRKGIIDRAGKSLLAFGLDGGGAIGKRLLHEPDNVRLRLVLIAF